MTTWILLRGLTREHGHWGHFPALLAQAVPHARVHAPDLPGTGQRHRARSPATVADIAAAVRAELRREALVPPYRLLGLSLGGMVAAHWAATWPDEIEGCVLVNTSTRLGSAWHQRLQPAQIPGLLASLFDANARRAEQRILAATSNRPEAHAEVLAAWLRIRRERPVSVGNALRQLAAAMRFRPVSETPPSPTLVIVSRADRLVDPACSQALARAWQVPLRAHPSAGHDLAMDDPDWLVTQLATWQPHRRAVTPPVTPL
jgi:pimeloyl-ACP methyl ester carboxylesterase